MAPSTPQQRKELLIRVGKTLYGERYGAPLARGMGVDQSLIARIVANERTVTDLQLQQLANLLGSEWKRHHEQIKLIEHMVDEVTGFPLEMQPHLIPGADLGPEPQNQ